MSRGTRDNQRSRVYAWESAVTRDEKNHGTMKTIEEVEAFLRPIWRAERGRYGRAKVPMPALHPGHRGQRRAIAYDSHMLSLPRWARNPWVILHEAAHRLTPSDEAHGPRFVGVLIGLAARHLGHDADEMMALADEMGVRYHVRSIGAVPAASKPYKLLRLITAERVRMTVMEAACELDWTWRQVSGALLGLRRAGKARLWRGKIVPIEPKPEPEKPKKIGRRTHAEWRVLAAEAGVEVERLGDGWMVFPPPGLDESLDPHEGDHFTTDPAEIRRRAEEYVRIWAARQEGQ